MAEVAGTGIDLTSLETALNRLNKQYDTIIKQNGALEHASIKAFQQVARSGVENLNAALKKTISELSNGNKSVNSGVIDSINKQVVVAKQQLEEMSKRLNNLSNTAGKKKKTQITIMIEDIERAKIALSSLTNQLSQSNTTVNTSVSSQPQSSPALAQPTSVPERSVAGMRQKIEELRKAQEKLDLSTKEGRKRYSELGREIAATEKKLKRVEDGQKRLNKNIQEGKRAYQSFAQGFTAYFSLQSITEFIKRIAQVRGEMELQHKSMQVILQDKEAADKLWGQTMQLALQSPFTIKQLIGYTRNLTAYRIETEKLHDTTKRLADVSAGLGVDMQRMILAYGQVRAANYLRGTELRQFTEAGVPLLDELAQHFTQLEGRVVKADEVFARISKRMVLFEDVEEVFRKMTDEGGVFFDMQRKQSETLAGQMAKIADAITLTLNALGTEYEETLKNGVDLIRNVISNYEELIPAAGKSISNIVGFLGKLVFKLVDISTLIRIISDIIIVNLTKKALLGLWGILSKLPALLRTIYRSIISIKTAGLASSFAALPAVIPVIITLGLVIYELTRSVDMLSEAFARVDEEILKDKRETEAEYEKLTAAVRDLTKSYDERNKALEELQKKFKDILPDQYTELEYILKAANGYKEATDAMAMYYNEKAIAQKQDKVEEQYSDDIDSTIKDLAKHISTSFTFSTKAGPRIYLDKHVIAAKAEEVKVELKRGEITLDKVNQRLADKLAKWYSLPLDAHIQLVGNITKSYWSLKDNLESYYEDMQAARGLFFETPEQRQAAEVYRQEQVEVEKLKEKINELKNAWHAYYTALHSEKDDGKQKRVADALDSLKKKYKEINGIQQQFPKNIEEITTSQYAVGEELRRIENIIWETYKSGKDATKGLTYLTISNVEKIQEKLETEDWQVAAVDIFKQLAGESEQALKLLDRLTINNLESMEALKKKTGELVNEYKGLVEGAENHNQALANIPPFLRAPADIPTGGIAAFQEAAGFTDEQAAENKELLLLLQLFYSLLGGASKSKKSNKSKKDDISAKYRDMLNILKELWSDFKDLNAVMSENDAKQLVLEKHAKSFAHTYKDLGWSIESVDFTNIEGVTEAMERLIAEAKKHKQLADFVRDTERTIASISIDESKRLDVEAFEKIEKEIEDLFSGYEIYIELQDVGVSSDFAKSIFGLEATSTEELRAALEDMRKKGLFAGQEELKKYEEYLGKIEELENKAQTKRLKTYLEYTRKSTSKRAQIKLQELKKLAEIEDTFNKAYENAKTDEDRRIVEEARSAAISGVRRDTNKELDTLSWEEFKETDTFVRIFGDLQNASEAAIKSMINHLQDYKSTWANLDIKDVKELTKKLEELKNAQQNIEISKGFFASYKSIRKDIKADGRTYQQAEEDMVNAEFEVASYNQQISDLEVIQQQLRENKDVTQLIDEYNKRYNSELKATNDSLTESLQIVKGKRDAAQEEVVISKTQLENYSKQKKSLDKIYGNMENVSKMANDLYGAFESIYEALGGDDESPAAIFAEMGMNMANTVLDCIMLQIQLKAVEVAAKGVGAAMNTAMGIVGWIVMAVQVIAQVFTAIATNKDNKIKKKIEETKEEVEKLQKAFEKLEEAIENAFTANDLQRQFRDGIANLNEQIQKQEELIALEESRKKSKRDENAIKEAKEEIEELQEKRNELLRSTVEDLGGTYDIRVAAREFVDAWVDAFRETGNGLKGLEDNFKEFFENILFEQAVMTGAGAIIQPLLDDITAALEDDYLLDETETKGIQKMAKDQLGKLNTFMESFYSMYPEIFDAASELSGLSAGIEGITENQADVISSYLNTIRFFVASIDAKTSELIALQGGATQQNDANPMLAQLQIVAQQTTAINELLSSVRKAGHSHGGYGIKVFVD